MGKEFEKEQKKKKNIDYLKNIEYLNRQDSMDEPHNIFTHTHTHTHHLVQFIILTTKKDRKVIYEY